jgi:hypothetical protein
MVDIASLGIICDGFIEHDIVGVIVVIFWRYFGGCACVGTYV